MKQQEIIESTTHPALFAWKIFKKSNLYFGFGSVLCREIVIYIVAYVKYSNFMVCKIFLCF